MAEPQGFGGKSADFEVQHESHRWANSAGPFVLSVAVADWSLNFPLSIFGNFFLWDHDMKSSGQRMCVLYWQNFEARSYSHTSSASSQIEWS